MMIGVMNFAANHTAHFPEGTRGAILFANLDAVVKALSGHATAKSSKRGAARQATVKKAVARAALLELLTEIARTARAIAAERPGLHNRFQPPRQAAGRDLLAAAQGMLEQLEPLRAEFVGYGIRPDFVERLRELVTEFEFSLGERKAAAETAAATTVSIERLVTEGMGLVRLLDVAVRNTLKDFPDALSAWERASHVEKIAKSAPPEPSAATIAKTAAA